MPVAEATFESGSRNETARSERVSASTVTECRMRRDVHHDGCRDHRCPMQPTTQFKMSVLRRLFRPRGIFALLILAWCSFTFVQWRTEKVDREVGGKMDHRFDIVREILTGVEDQLLADAAPEIVSR